METRPYKRAKQEESDIEDDDEGEDDDELVDDEEEPEYDDKGQLIERKRGKVKGKGGSSCHQCKSRRNFTALTYCTSNLDKKNKRCRKKFCGHCLKKFYKESAAAISDKTNWKCPSCRKICCCAACRRRKAKDGDTDVLNKSPTIEPRKYVPKKSHAHSHSHAHHNTTQHQSSYNQSNYDTYNNEEESNMYAAGAADPSNAVPEHSYHHSLSSDYPMSSSHVSPDLMQQQHNYHEIGEASVGGNKSHGEEEEEDQDMDAYASYGVVEEDEDGGDKTHEDVPVLPSSQFTTLLAQHIRRLAEESARDPHSSFARLYRESQHKHIKRKIRSILLQEDIKKEKKVELIASLLVPLQQSMAAAAHANFNSSQSLSNPIHSS